MTKEFIFYAGVMMLEADVILGHSGNNTEMTPVMGHPPNTSSDLSLEEFLDTVIKNGTKGIKLDFKSFKAFNKSIPILEKHKAVSLTNLIYTTIFLIDVILRIRLVLSTTLKSRVTQISFEI